MSVSVNVRRSAIRAVRTFAQVAAAVLSAAALGTTFDFKVVGSVYVAAAGLAAHAAVISFLQNVAEDATETAVVSKE